MKRGIKFLGTVFVLGFFVAPSLVQGVLQIPTANLTIVKNTVGDEGNFSFSIKEQIDGNFNIFDEFSLQTNGNTAVYNTNISAFSGERFLITEASQEGWNLSGIVCISDNPVNTFYPEENGVTIFPTAYSNITCTFTNQKIQEQKDPVIIIPGIMGSFQKNGEWVIDPILHSYENLIETLIANGYQEGVDLFRFPYDWRQSNKVTALYLENKIEDIKQICGCDKVDLVAHSMGGLVARQYIQSDRYNQDVDRLIFLGTPHLGSPKAYLAWEAGEVGPTVVLDDLYKFFVSREAKKEGFNDSFDYIKNYPILSVQELLPIFNYLKEYATGNERIYPYFYPRNEFLEGLNNNIDKGSRLADNRLIA